jgi:hypothetical protein
MLGGMAVLALHVGRALLFLYGSLQREYHRRVLGFTERGSGHDHVILQYCLCISLNWFNFYLFGLTCSM